MAALAELHGAGLADEPDLVARRAEGPAVEQADTPATRHEQRRRPRAGDLGRAPRLERAEHGRPGGEDERAVVVHPDRAVASRRQVALSVPRNRVRNADAVCARVHRHRPGRVARRQRQRDTAGRGHVALVDRAARTAARVTVAVQVADDGRGPRLGAVAGAARLRDHRAAEPARAGLVPEDLEEAVALETDLVGDHLSRCRDDGAGQREHPARHALFGERTVRADVAARRGHVQVLDPHLAKPEHEVILQIAMDVESRRGGWKCDERGDGQRQTHAQRRVHSANGTFHRRAPVFAPRRSESREKFPVDPLTPPPCSVPHAVLRPIA